MSTATMSKIKTKVMEITPELALEYLKKNTRNRPLRPTRVVEIMGWIRKGQWELTTDAIGFDTNGDLINGQHRLSAIVKVGKPVECIVTWGLTPEAFNVIDTVKVRSAGDVLGVNGFNNPTRRAGIVRFIMMFKKGKFSDMTKGSVKASNQEILDFADKNRDKINEAGMVAQRTVAKFRGLEDRFIGGLYWFFAEKDKDQAELFFKYFEDGVGLSANDPILILRQRLIQNLGSNKKVNGTEKLAWTILAWNAIRSGTKIKLIRWSADVSEFPKIV